MANYNYIDIDDIWQAVTTLETCNSVTVYTSHGDRIMYSKFGNEYIRVERKGFSGCCSDMADLIMASFVNDRVRLRVKRDGQPVKWYRYWDLGRVNNPRHPLYLGLYDLEDATEIVGKVGFWWDAEFIPDGIEYGVH